ncbi:hypothetical protein [Buchananella hordeovulneris]|uniref:hypothetical protein n=1 Tax=Buchananella hordeovulneris TaxID=52770 RepID=UPI0026DBA1F3|nr:hypothetical protein [Buchananella hordeovulneris]MDO5080311.1 hypothetical protein [Buchananella hordeovulneris]
MSLFEFDSGQLSPAQFGRAVDGELPEELLLSVRDNLDQILTRPLFPVLHDIDASDAAAKTPWVIALDGAGQAVSLEVVACLNSRSLAAALARAAEVATLGWNDLAAVYAEGPTAFRTQWAAFRSSLPPTIDQGPRLTIIAGAVEEAVRPGLDFLTASGVEVRLLEVRALSTGRQFVEIVSLDPLFGLGRSLLAAHTPELPGSGQPVAGEPPLLGAPVEESDEPAAALPGPDEEDSPGAAAAEQATGISEAEEGPRRPEAGTKEPTPARSGRQRRPRPAPQARLADDTRTPAMGIPEVEAAIANAQASAEAQAAHADVPPAGDPATAELQLGPVRAAARSRRAGRRTARHSAVEKRQSDTAARADQPQATGQKQPGNAGEHESAAANGPAAEVGAEPQRERRRRQRASGDAPQLGQSDTFTRLRQVVAARRREHGEVELPPLPSRRRLREQAPTILDEPAPAVPDAAATKGATPSGSQRQRSATRRRRQELTPPRPRAAENPAAAAVPPVATPEPGELVTDAPTEVLLAPAAPTGEPVALAPAPQPPVKAAADAVAVEAEPGAVAVAAAVPVPHATEPRQGHATYPGDETVPRVEEAAVEVVTERLAPPTTVPVERRRERQPAPEAPPVTVNSRPAALVPPVGAAPAWPPVPRPATPPVDLPAPIDTGSIPRVATGAAPQRRSILEAAHGRRARGGVVVESAVPTQQLSGEEQAEASLLAAISRAAGEGTPLFWVVPNAPLPGEPEGWLVETGIRVIDGTVLPTPRLAAPEVGAGRDPWDAWRIGSTRGPSLGEAGREIQARSATARRNRR